MKVGSGMTLVGLGLLLCCGSPARAQWGGMGEAVKKGATDAAKQEVMKGAAEMVGLPTPVTPAVTPAAEAGAAAPAAEPAAADAPAADAPAAEAPAAEPAAE